MATFDTNTTPDIPIQSVSDVAAELAAIIVKEETNHLTLDPAPTGVPTTEGTLSWNDQDHTLNIQTEVSGVTQQVGQEQFVRCRNNSGTTISNGKVVYLSGSSGQRPTIALASRSTDAHVESTIGIATHDIDNNSDGYVTTMGLVRGVTTTGLTEGAPIYLDTTAGSFTTTRPTSGHVVRVGWVVVAGNNGTILVHTERLSTTNAFVTAAIAEDPAAARAAANLGPVVYANDYGATGDGVTNDTNALQNAIDYLSSVGGGVLHVPQGVYRLSSTTIHAGIYGGAFSLLVPSNITIRGDGPGRTIFKFLDSAPLNRATFHSDANSTNIEFADFEIDGNEQRLAPGVNEGEGINIKEGSSFIRFRNLYIHHTEGDGIDFDGVDYIDIINCYIYETRGCGIHLAGTGTSNVRITGCLIRECAHERLAEAPPGTQEEWVAGIDCLNSSQVTITSTTFWNNAINFSVYNGGREIQLVGCNLFQGASRLQMRVRGNNQPTDFRNIVVSGCSFRGIGTGGVGILAEDSIFGLSIHGCSFRQESHAIHIKGAMGVAISGCYIRSEQLSSNYAVYVESLASGGKWSLSNTFVDCSGTAINALRVKAGSSQSGLVAGCRLDGTSAAVHFEGGVATIRGSYLTASGSNAIKFQTTTGAVIADSTIAKRLEILTGGHLFRNNIITGDLIISSGGATGLIFENNQATGTWTFSSTTPSAHTWSGNTGSAMSIFRGSATLTSGTATVSTIAAASGATIRLFRKGAGASTAIGSLAVGTITANTSFVINSLNASASVETGDASTVQWEILYP